MKLFQQIGQLDSTIESLLDKRRELASSAPNCADIVDTSEAAELAELRAYRKHYKRPPKWAGSGLRLLGLIEGRISAAIIGWPAGILPGPRVALDARRIAAAIVLVAAMGVAGTTGSGPAQQKYSPTGAQDVYVDETTGDSFMSSDGTREGAETVGMIVAGGVYPVHSIERYEALGRWSWAKVFFNEADSTWVSAGTRSKENKTDEWYTDFMVQNGALLWTTFEDSLWTKYGEEEIVVDGATYHFTKYVIDLEGLPTTTFWQGFPVIR